MSLSAHFKAKCDGCGIIVERDVVLNKKTAQGIMSEGEGVISYARDIWSWCIPDGWIQIIEDGVHLFFHDKDCFETC